MKAIIFDLDGTLIDSAPDIHLACNAVLSDLGMGPVTLAQVRGFVGHGAGVLVQRLITAVGLPQTDHAAILAAFLARYETAVHLTRLYPGVRGALDRLRGAGWQMGLCTNKPLAPTRAVLAHLGLVGDFAVVIGGDSLAQRKPDPAPLRATLAGLGADRALFVGDSEVDAETAQRAALPFALYTEGYRKTPIAQLPHDMAFSDFTALPDLARQWCDGHVDRHDPRSVG